MGMFVVQESMDVRAVRTQSIRSGVGLELERQGSHARAQDRLPLSAAWPLRCGNAAAARSAGTQHAAENPGDNVVRHP